MPPDTLDSHPHSPEARLTQLEPFRLGEGRLWLAVDAELGRRVLLKESLASRHRSAREWGHFLWEAQVTAQLQHPHVVPVYGLGHRASDNVPFLVLRYLDGPNLREAAQDHHEGRSGALPMRALLAAFVACCRAVAHAHARGVLHGDVKPAHVVLGPGGEVAVVDWGLSRPIERAAGGLSPRGGAAPREPGDGAVLGTPAYMAPEVAAGGRGGVRAEVYALSATLFHVLTGSPPWPGADPIQVLERLQREPAPRARSVQPRVPAELDALCARALAQRPQERPSGAGELAAAVEAWLTTQPGA